MRDRTTDSLPVWNEALFIVLGILLLSMGPLHSGSISQGGLHPQTGITVRALHP